MKYLFCVLSCFLTTWCATAQEWVLKGTLGFPGGEIFTYELHLQEETNGTLQGYSLLYAQPGKETKATLIGQINRAENTLSISEQSIDYSRNFESKAYICRISAKLQYHPYASAGRPGLFGITGTNEYNDKRCNTGTLSFNGSDALRKFFSAQPAPVAIAKAETAVPEIAGQNLPLPQPLPAAANLPVSAKKTAAAKNKVTATTALPQQALDTAPHVTEEQPESSIENMPSNQKPSPRRFYFPKKEKKVVAEEPAVPEIPKPRDTTGGLHLIAGESANITCTSDVLEVSVFAGGGKVDGDQITLQYNERNLLKNFTLRATTQQIRLPLGKGGKLTVIGIAEGSEKPCVAYLYIKDGALLHRFVLSLSAGEEAAVIVQTEDQP